LVAFILYQGVIAMERVMEIISLLGDKDKEKILEFADVLIKQNKYNKLRKEIENRQDEIKRGEVLTHEEIWQDI